MFNKKIISIILAFIMIIQPVQQLVYADENNQINTQNVNTINQQLGTTTETLITANISPFIFDEKTGTITGYKTKDVPVNLEIPSQINGVTVEHIGGKEAFRYSTFSSSKLNRPLESVTFPEGLKSIGYWAFQGNNLKKIVLPKSLEKLDKRSFAINKNLEEVDFQGNTLIKELPEEVFLNCKLSNIDLPSSIETIGDSALKENLLTKIELSDNVTNIGVQAFALNYIEDAKFGANLIELNKDRRGKEAKNGIFFRNFYEPNKTRITKLYTDSNLATAKNTNAIVNPANLKIEFVDEKYNTIKEPITIVGIEKKKIVITKHPKYSLDVANLGNGDLSYITDYIVPTDKVEFHSKFFEDISNNYFKKGEKYIIKPEKIANYETPEAKEISFDDYDNEIKFIYKKSASVKFNIKGENIKSSISPEDAFIGNDVTITIEEPKNKIIDKFTVNGDDKKSELITQGIKKVYKFTIQGDTEIEVSYKDDVYTEEFEIKSEKAQLSLGEKTKIKAFYRGQEIETSNPDLNFKIEPQDMAKFDKNTGELTALSSGTFALTATVQNSSNSKSKLDFKVNSVKVKIRIEGNHHTVLNPTEVEVDKISVKKGVNYYTDIEFEKPVVFLAAEKAIRENTDIKTYEKDQFDFNPDGNWMKKIGNDISYSTTGSFMLVVNGEHAKFGAGTQEIKDGDYIVIYYMENWGDMLYTYFSPEEIETKKGENLSFTLNSLPFSMSGGNITPGKVKDAILMNDKDPLLDKDGKEIKSDENGVFNYTFDKEGTYHISATKINANNQVNISRPYLKIIVKANQDDIDITEIEKWAKEKINLIADDYANKEVLKDWWAISEIGKLGKPINKKTLDWIYEQTIDKDGKLKDNTNSNTKNILALRAAGIDVQNYYGYNLVEALAKNNIQDRGLWAHAPAIWALNSDDYDIDERLNKEIDALLSQQKDNGLWETWGWKDSTGFALYALAPYYNKRDDVKQAFEKAVNEISKRQFEDGDITEGGGNNNSVVMIIGGLVSANPDYVKDKRLIKNGNTLLHVLKKYDVPNKPEFLWKIGEESGKPMATEQSFRMLISYFSVKEGKGYVFDYRNTPKKVLPQQEIQIQLDKTSININEKIQLKAVYKANQQAIANDQIKWSVEPKSIAKIDENTGQLTALTSGTFILTAALKTDEQIKDSVEIKVEEDKKDTIEELEQWAKEKMNLIADDYANKEVLKDWWAIADLGKLGKPINEATLNYLYSQTIAKDGKINPKAGINLKNILALRAAGIDVQNYYGHDLVKELEKSALNGIWIQVPTIWALNSDNYGADEKIEKEIEKLLSQRADSGLWESSWGWADDTGFALYALAPFYNTKPEIKEAFEKAVDSISLKQLPNGDITSGDGNNNALVMVIGGLVSANPDYIKDPRLIKNKNTLLHALKAYDLVNTPGFSWKIGQNEKNDLATEQSFRAFVTYFSVKEGKGYVYDYRNTPKRVLPDNNTAKEYKLNVIGGNGSGNYKAGTIINITATDVANKVFDKWTATGITLDNPNSKSIKITMPANEVNLQANWKDSESGGGGGGTTPSKPKVKLSIDKLTINKGYVVETVELTFSQGDSVWDITKKVLEDRNIVYDAEFTPQYNSIYVKSIDKDGEFDHGPGSGWMYSVNGVYPDRGATLVYPKNGDIIRWRYTTNLGNDIGGGMSDTQELKDTLKKYIDSAKAYNKNEYTQESYKNLSKALEEAQKVFDNPNSSNIDYLEATQKLNKAIKAMEKLSYGAITDNYKEDLNKKLKEIENMKLNPLEFDKKEYEKFEKILNKAKETYKKGEVSYQELKEIIDELDKALGGLKKDKTLVTIPSQSLQVPKGLTKTEGEHQYKDSDNISSWAKEYVSKARAYGLMKGDTNNNFNPKKPITRAEVATIISNFVGDKPYTKNTKTFKDVNKDTWYFESIDKVVSLGFLTGMSKDTFEPQKTLTREQLAVIIVNIINYDKSLIKAPKDDKSISEWAKDAVSIVYARDIMKGDKEIFDPKGQVSREMIAVVMVKLYEENQKKES